MGSRPRGVGGRPGAGRTCSPGSAGSRGRVNAGRCGRGLVLVESRRPVELWVEYACDRHVGHLRAPRRLLDRDRAQLARRREQEQLARGGHRYEKAAALATGADARYRLRRALAGPLPPEAPSAAHTRGTAGQVQGGPVAGDPEALPEVAPLCQLSAGQLTETGRDCPRTAAEYVRWPTNRSLRAPSMGVPTAAKLRLTRYTDAGQRRRRRRWRSHRPGFRPVLLSVGVLDSGR